MYKLDDTPPAYGTSHGSGPSAPLMMGSGVSSTSMQQQPVALMMYTRLGSLLRAAQVILYIAAYLQILVIPVAMCVFFSHVNTADEFHPALISTMLHNVFVLVCGAIGLLAASGRSRVVLMALIPLALCTAAQACILINFFINKCDTEWQNTVCIFGDNYDKGDYTAIMANLGLNVAFGFSSAGAALFMLISSIATKDRTP